MSATVLKLIAIVAMLCDHVGYVLLPQYAILRIVGRLTMPIMCFFIAEGAVKSRNPEKYALRLLVFALLSEIPFDLALFGRVFALSHQNVFFTLFLGLAAVLAARRILAAPGRAGVKKVAALGVIALMGLVATLLQTDYILLGVFLIAAFYFLRGRRVASAAAVVLFSLAGALQVYNGNVMLSAQIYAVFAAVPLFFYNGQRGKGLKYLFYIFYPAHLFLIWLLARGLHVY